MIAQLPVSRPSANARPATNGVRDMRGWPRWPGLPGGDNEGQLSFEHAAIGTVAAWVLCSIPVPAHATDRTVSTARVNAVRTDTHHVVRDLPTCDGTLAFSTGATTVR